MIFLEKQGEIKMKLFDISPHKHLPPMILQKPLSGRNFSGKVISLR